jgi:hypothetical protein
MHNKGKNSCSGPAYSTRATIPSRLSTLFLNEECRRKDAHVVPSKLDRREEQMAEQPQLVAS